MNQAASEVESSHPCCSNKTDTHLDSRNRGEKIKGDSQSWNQETGKVSIRGCSFPRLGCIIHKKLRVIKNSLLYKQPRKSLERGTCTKSLLFSLRLPF